jgi:hypothetical protein
MIPWKYIISSIYNLFPFTIEPFHLSKNPWVPKKYYPTQKGVSKGSQPTCIYCWYQIEKEEHETIYIRTLVQVEKNVTIVTTTPYFRCPQKNWIHRREVFAHMLNDETMQMKSPCTLYNNVLPISFRLLKDRRKKYCGIYYT